MRYSPLSILFAAGTIVIATLLVANPALVASNELLIFGISLTAILVFWFMSRQIGIYKTAYLFMVATVIGFICEYIGLHSNAYFGEYEYTDFLGYKLYGIPVIIPIAWFISVTIAFMLARLILGFGRRVRPLTLFTFASLLAVIYDLPIEYMAKYIWRSWTWFNGGPILDVPTLNFIGWFIVAFIIYGLGSNQWQNINRDKRGYHDLQIVCFFSFGLTLFHLVLDLLQKINSI